MTPTKKTKEFDKEYGTKDPKIWAIGIVAEALGHEKINGFGADASHITKKLLELNSQAISEARADERRKVIGSIGAELLARHSPQTMLDAYFEVANEELEK